MKLPPQQRNPISDLDGAVLPDSLTDLVIVRIPGHALECVFFLFLHYVLRAPRRLYLKKGLLLRAFSRRAASLCDIDPTLSRCFLQDKSLEARVPAAWLKRVEEGSLAIDFK